MESKQERRECCIERSFWGNNDWKPKFPASLALLLGQQNWNYWEFLFRNQRPKEAVTFLNANRKEVLTQTPIFKKNILQELRWNKDIFKWRKTKKIHCQQICSKRTAKGKFFREKKYDIRWNLNIRNERSNRNSKSLSSVRIFKICLKTESKCLMYLDIIH